MSSFITYLYIYSLPRGTPPWFTCQKQLRDRIMISVTGQMLFNVCEMFFSHFIIQRGFIFHKGLTCRQTSLRLCWVNVPKNPTLEYKKDACWSVINKLGQNNSVEREIHYRRFFMHLMQYLFKLDHYCINSSWPN